MTTVGVMTKDIRRYLPTLAECSMRFRHVLLRRQPSHCTIASSRLDVMAPPAEDEEINSSRKSFHWEQGGIVRVLIKELEEGN